MLSDGVMAWAGGLSAAAWVVIPLGAVAWPARTHDPQRGQAVGCLMMVSAAGAVLGCVLGLGVWMGWSWLVRGAGTVLVFPVVLMGLNAAAWPVVRVSRAVRSRKGET